MDKSSLEQIKCSLKWIFFSSYLESKKSSFFENLLNMYVVGDVSNHHDYQQKFGGDPECPLQGGFYDICHPIFFISCRHFSGLILAKVHQ